jgi:hypothetical protein
VVFAYHDFPTCGRHGPIPLSRAKGCLKAFELMVYMACCPGIAKRAAQLLALTALCVAASWIGLCDPPTNRIYYWNINSPKLRYNIILLE